MENFKSCIYPQYFLPSFVNFADFLFRSVRTWPGQQTKQHVLLFGSLPTDGINTFRLEIVSGFTEAAPKAIAKL